MSGVWEQRWHPFRREWVVIAAHRDRRPWIGETVRHGGPALPAYDPRCTFCPGNRRSSGVRNPDYAGVFAFDNDHPCVGPDAPAELQPAPGSYRNRRADGLARVVCYHPRHDLRLASLDVAAVDALLACWQQQYRELGARPAVRHVLVFENNGEVVGVSNPHPHCQIYATNFVFKTIENEVAHCDEHLAAHGRTLWDDCVRTELDDGRRLLDVEADALAFVPYFARYAYETFVGPRRSVASIAALDDVERLALARVLRATLQRFDRLFDMPFPYVMALHQAPTDGRDHAAFGFHVELHPPLRRPGLLKYLAGPEIGGGSFLSDTCPEDKAAELRAAAPPA
ncbi:MAG: galactose-1-phosphate uridylyltransferase [Planctomycetes bacterium]|nr:galactose-1-phosphate uridylyltransferase [Planctomycetota bacterium]